MYSFNSVLNYGDSIGYGTYVLLNIIELLLNEMSLQDAVDLYVKKKRWTFDPDTFENEAQTGLIQPYYNHINYGKIIVLKDTKFFSRKQLALFYANYRENSMTVWLYIKKSQVDSLKDEQTLIIDETCSLNIV